MLIRSNDGTSTVNDDQKKEISKQSIEFGKKAINFNIKDCDSWCNFTFLNFIII